MAKRLWVTFMFCVFYHNFQNGENELANPQTRPIILKKVIKHLSPCSLWISNARLNEWLSVPPVGMICLGSNDRSSSCKHHAGACVPSNSGGIWEQMELLILNTPILLRNKNPFYPPNRGLKSLSLVVAHPTFPMEVISNSFHLA